MSTATNRFFNIAELIYLTTTYLDKVDTSQLSRTCRRLHHWIEPALFDNIIIKYDPHGTNILTSPDSFRALSRNIPVVRSLCIGLSETIFLYSCFRAFETGPTATAAHADSSQLAVPTRTEIVSLPPMSMLAKLTVFLTYTARDDSCPYLPTLIGNTRGEFERTCWLLRMSEHLVKVEVHSLDILNRREFVVVARTIASIPRLEELYLEVALKNKGVPRFPAAFEVWSELFFVCPRSICKYEVKVDDCAYDVEENDMESERRVKEELAALRRQQEQGQGQGHLLPRLTDLVLGLIDDDSTGEGDVRKVLEHCPNLVSLRCREMTATVFSQNNLASIVATCCPLLKKVSFEYAASNNYILPRQLMLEIPEQQMQEFRWNTYPFPLEGPKVIMMFSRHSSTLRKIILGRHINVSSNVLRCVLVSCSALEELSAQLVAVFMHRRQTHAAFVTLEDAVENPWVCTRLRHLDLAVSIPPLPKGPDQVPYYRKMAADRSAAVIMCALSSEEWQHFTILERLYRQIGSLSQLTHLKLKAFVLDQLEGVGGVMAAYVNNTFPALLSLGDIDRSGRPGYLECLAGLTKLRELRGSVRTNTEETKVTMGWSEAKWMATHWPNLEIAEFFGKDDKLTDPFLWLQDQSKGAKLNVSAPRI
ncbi:hypothetical protein BG015_005978 [Linnemannia schmuckeri]|uniref:Uncharacterized protein n=1 Tax=Linnemannia schmuckeri TaxID=64567 RepID=A0A9P5VFE1_9FUNG|nr:hypothetical protein BG015_005978 [Linnemannia schmuckeri]